jgi:glycosyltransferase involved in cell wall biosynthesis
VTISVVTPTCDRPIAFALLERWMARQTVQPTEWIVADGGATPVRCTQGQRHLPRRLPPGARNFATNLTRGMQAATGDILVVVEDDDWYASTHLATIVAQLRTAHALAAGDDQQRYYNLRHRTWRRFDNRGASLCQTAFRRAALPRFLDAIQGCAQGGTYGIDALFWASIPPAARALARTETVVGMKSLPGQVGLGIGHRPDGRWTPDPDLAQLRAWIGDDVAPYAALAERVA